MHSHPIPRTAGYLFTSIGGGFLVAWFFIEIGGSGQIVWKKALETEVTLYLLIYAAVAYWYFRDLWRFERDLLRWLDPDYRKARLIEEIWPEFVEAARERIKSGVAINLEELTQDMLQ